MKSMTLLQILFAVSTAAAAQLPAYAANCERYEKGDAIAFVCDDNSNLIIEGPFGGTQWLYSRRSDGIWLTGVIAHKDGKVFMCGELLTNGEDKCVSSEE